jgi:hypothetical protein
MVSTDVQVMDDASDLGGSIRARRRACRLGQVDLAQAAGVGLTALRDLEQHRWTPTRSRVVLTLERLGWDGRR